MQVLAILDDLVTRRGMGLLFISHDLRLVGSFCDRVLVMYGGRIVETLAAADLDRAAHPYTRGLLAALPSLGRAGEPLPVLERDPAWLEDGRGSRANGSRGDSAAGRGRGRRAAGTPFPAGGA